MAKETLPPNTPLKENRTRTSTGTGTGTGQNARARVGESPGPGPVDVGKSNDGVQRVPISYDLIMDESHDPVQIALLVLRIPKKSIGSDGRRYNNARIIRWYVSRIGEQFFRELVYQQWRENVIDGVPKNITAAFMTKLYEAHGGTRRRDNLRAATAS